MDTNTMELNLQEMENVNGGTILSAVYDKKALEKSLSSKIVEACIDTGKKAYVFGRIAISWVTGLFD